MQLEKYQSRELDEIAPLALLGAAARAVPWAARIGAGVGRVVSAVTPWLARGASAVGRVIKGAAGLGKSALRGTTQVARRAAGAAEKVAGVVNSPAMQGAQAIRDRQNAKNDQEQAQQAVAKQRQQSDKENRRAAREQRRLNKPSTVQPAETGGLSRSSNRYSPLAATSESVRTRMGRLLDDVGVPTAVSNVSGATTSANVGAHYGVPFPAGRRGRTPLLTRVFPTSAKAKGKSRKHKRHSKH